MGPLYRIGGLYDAVVTMLVESCALYVVNLSCISVRGVPGAMERTPSQSHPKLRFVIFLFCIFTKHRSVRVQLLNREEQVIAPFLIILRATNRRAFTDDAIVSGTPNLTSIHFGNQGSPQESMGPFLMSFP